MDTKLVTPPPAKRSLFQTLETPLPTNKKTEADRNKDKNKKETGANWTTKGNIAWFIPLGINRVGLKLQTWRHNKQSFFTDDHTSTMYRTQNANPKQIKLIRVTYQVNHVSAVIQKSRLTLFLLVSKHN
ncbi:Uncharacterized protein Fot_34312 [Forsythia ovata]|uniref:Uncharacterized protein n=1 Tax=Forsythia ovata TaxID=205694 RepID=A0ABD1SIA9_9LAMI